MKLLNLLILALPQHLYLTFNGDCLKQNKFYYTPDNITNIYIVYDLTSTTNYNPDFTLENCLFGSVKITKITMLISINILDMVLDMMEKEFLRIQLVVLVMMQYFLEKI